VKRLHTAIAALWHAGASVQAIEDEVEDAMRRPLCANAG
jgi:hypothetical protein